MKIFVLKVVYDDFEYDEINDVIVVAENEEQAAEIAKTQREVRWEITNSIATANASPQLVKSYIYPG